MRYSLRSGPFTSIVFVFSRFQPGTVFLSRRHVPSFWSYGRLDARADLRRLFQWEARKFTHSG